MIEFRDVTKRFEEEKVLEHLSLRLSDGGCYALTAPSGWGKTTVLRLLAGLEKPDSGTITGLPARVSMVFQEDRLLREKSAEGNVALVLPAGHDPIEPELAAVGLEDCGEKPVKVFSGGMKRRVAIVRAMMADSELLLLDEPFKGLDEAAKEKTMAYVQRRRAGRTLVLVTHDKQEAEYFHCQMISK